MSNPGLHIPELVMDNDPDGTLAKTLREAQIRIVELREQLNAQRLVNMLGPDTGILEIGVTWKEDGTTFDNLWAVYKEAPGVRYSGDNSPGAYQMTPRRIAKVVVFEVLQDHLALVGNRLNPGNAEEFLKIVYGDDYPRYVAEKRAIALSDSVADVPVVKPSRPKF
jgi:hypothetical protein